MKRSMGLSSSDGLGLGFTKSGVALIRVSEERAPSQVVLWFAGEEMMTTDMTKPTGLWCDMCGRVPCWHGQTAF